MPATLREHILPGIANRVHNNLTTQDNILSFIPKISGDPKRFVELKRNFLDYQANVYFNRTTDIPTLVATDEQQEYTIFTIDTDPLAFPESFVRARTYAVLQSHLEQLADSLTKDLVSHAVHTIVSSGRSADSYKFIRNTYELPNRLSCYHNLQEVRAWFAERGYSRQSPIIALMYGDVYREYQRDASTISPDYFNNPLVDFATGRLRPYLNTQFVPMNLDRKLGTTTIDNSVYIEAGDPGAKLPFRSTNSKANYTKNVTFFFPAINSGLRHMISQPFIYVDPYNTKATSYDPTETIRMRIYMVVTKTNPEITPTVTQLDYLSNI